MYLYRAYGVHSFHMMVAGYMSIRKYCRSYSICTEPTLFTSRNVHH